jgi:hypothetical protein
MLESIGKGDDVPMWQCGVGFLKPTQGQFADATVRCDDS